MNHECDTSCVDVVKSSIIGALEKLPKLKRGKRRVNDLNFEEIPKLYNELLKHDSKIIQALLLQAALNELVNDGKLVTGRKNQYFLAADTKK